MADPAVIIHGGAGSAWPEHLHSVCKDVLKEALDAAWQLLLNGVPGEAAVVAALRVLEGCEYFDAGYGSFPNENGAVFMDAALMRGDGHFASLANIPCVKYPSALVLEMFKGERDLFAVWTDRMSATLAAAIRESPDLKGLFGYEEDLSKLVADYPKQRAVIARGQQPHGGGTVGCVLRDKKGQLFAGTSTGGSMLKVDGRIGDSPVIGAGTFAQEGVCALSSTGTGEVFLKSMTSAHIVSRLRVIVEADPHACEAEPELLPSLIVDELNRMTARFPQGHGGVIAVPVFGPPAFAFNAEMLSVAYRFGNEEISDEFVALAS